MEARVKEDTVAPVWIKREKMAIPEGRALSVAVAREHPRQEAGTFIRDREQRQAATHGYRRASCGASSSGRRQAERSAMAAQDTSGLLVDHVAVVTGASSGLGRAAAIALARAGADVALLARSAADLQQVRTEIDGIGRRALIFPSDIARESAIGDAVRQTVERYGRIDILVNAAGTDMPGPVRDLAADDWDYVLAVNLRAPFLLVKAVLPQMQRAGPPPESRQRAAASQ